MPGFNPYEGLTHGGNSGQSLGDYYRNVQTNITKGLLDTNSEFYQNFRSFLGSVTSNPGANSFLSALQAGGGNFGASQVQAQQQQRGAEGRRNDFLNTATKGFASQNIGTAAGLVGQQQGSDLQQQGIALGNKQADAAMPGWLDFLGSIAGTVAGGLSGGLLGGGGGQGGGGSFNAYDPNANLKPYNY